MRLSEQSGALLSAIQFDASTPVAELARKLKVQTHSLHYHLRRFREEGVIRASAFINPYALGFTQHTIYFSIAPDGKSTSEELLEYLGKHEQVAWLAEVGGRFQYAFTYCARSVYDLSRFFDTLVRDYGDIFFEKTIATNLSFTLFRKRYLSAEDGQLDYLEFGESEEVESLDSLDLEILAALTSEGLKSHQEVSRLTGVPRSTVQYRIKAMEDAGIIQHYIYSISPQQLSIEVYKILVYTRGFSNALREEIFQFCKEHSNIVSFIHCVGDWDFEITLEVFRSSDVTECVQALCGEYGSSISKTEVLPVFNQTQSERYMAVRGRDD